MRYVCCAAVQGVNGHSRKVTVGQKGQHRLPSLALHLAVDHNGKVKYVFVVSFCMISGH